MTQNASLSVRMFGFLGTSFSDGKERADFWLPAQVWEIFVPLLNFAVNLKVLKKKKKVLIMEFNLKNKTRRIHKNLLKMGQGN